jgi:hypothetical protein
LRRAAGVVGGALAATAFAPALGAAENAKPAVAPRAPAANVAAPRAASATADLELLEFLGSDDVEPELQQYLASRGTARGRSETK